MLKDLQWRQERAAVLSQATVCLVSREDVIKQAHDLMAREIKEAELSLSKKRQESEEQLRKLGEEFNKE